MSGDIGVNIKKLRKERGLTQNDIAEKLFTTPQNVSRVESGDGEPTVEMLINMADIFNVSVDTLVGRRQIFESELLDKTASYIGTSQSEEIQSRIFAVCKSILKGKFQNVLGENISISKKTYSTLTASGTLGVFSDRVDCPKAFAAIDKKDFCFSQTDAKALSRFFNALSNPKLISTLSAIFNAQQELKSYDLQSFNMAFDINEAESEQIINALIDCKCVEISEMFMNGEKICLYHPYVTSEVLILLQLAKLLFTCHTDGNA